METDDSARSTRPTRVASDDRRSEGTLVNGSLSAPTDASPILSGDDGGDSHAGNVQLTVASCNTTPESAPFTNHPSTVDDSLLKDRLRICAGKSGIVESVVLIPGLSVGLAPDASVDVCPSPPPVSPSRDRSPITGILILALSSASDGLCFGKSSVDPATSYDFVLGGGGRANGNSNQNMLPFPHSEFTPNRPLCSFIICRTKANPNPEPFPPCRRPISVWTYGENNRLLKTQLKSLLCTLVPSVDSLNHICLFETYTRIMHLDPDHRPVLHLLLFLFPMKFSAHSNRTYRIFHSSSSSLLFQPRRLFHLLCSLEICSGLNQRIINLHCGSRLKSRIQQFGQDPDRSFFCELDRIGHQVTDLIGSNPPTHTQLTW